MSLATGKIYLDMESRPDRETSLCSAPRGQSVAGQCPRNSNRKGCS